MADEKKEEVTKTDPEKEISESPEVPEELQEKTTGEEETSESKTESEPELSKREELYKSMKGEEEVAEETEETSGEEKPEEEKKEETSEEEKPIADRIKDKISKRIGKEVAKRKTAEEENADLRAENRLLKEQRETKPEEKKEDKEPTDDQIDAEYEKALSEGNFKYAAQINRYAITREKDKALEDVKADNKKQSDASALMQKKWVTLVSDFTVYEPDGKTVDLNHPLNLNNTNSSLYLTAMKFMQDKQLARDSGYDNPDKVLGFRLAVNDARRELIEAAERGEIDLNAHKPKKDKIKKLITDPKKRRKSELAAPESEATDTDKSPVVLTQADAASQEILRRKKTRVSGPRLQKV